MAPVPNEEKSTAPLVCHEVQPVPLPAVMLLTPKLHAVFGSGVVANAAVATRGIVEFRVTL